jgi:hypothetical protein
MAKRVIPVRVLNGYTSSGWKLSEILTVDGRDYALVYRRGATGWVC